jgi:hypothetical protein
MDNALRSCPRLVGANVGVISALLVSLSAFAIQAGTGRSGDYIVIGFLMVTAALVAGFAFAPGALVSRRRSVVAGGLFALVTIVGAGLITVVWSQVAGSDMGLGAIVLQIGAWFIGVGVMAGVAWIVLLRAIATGNLRLGAPALVTAFGLVGVSVMVETILISAH